MAVSASASESEAPPSVREIEYQTFSFSLSQFTLGSGASRPAAGVGGG